MIRDITIGQYYQTESPIHGLDPRVKLMGTLVFIISLFAGKSIWAYLFITVFLLIIIKNIKSTIKIYCKRIKSNSYYHNHKCCI